MSTSRKQIPEFQDEEMEGRDALETNEEFEQWARSVLYLKRKSNFSMQRVKSRIMYGGSFSLATAFVMLLIAARADYRYSGHGLFRRRTGGITLPGLMYFKALWCMMVGCFSLFAWFKRFLLRKDVCIAYTTFRVCEWFITFWLWVALTKNFGKGPFIKNSGISADQKAIYFFSWMICAFGLVNIVLNLRNLRKHWILFRVGAIKEFVVHENENKLRMLRQRSAERIATEIVPAALALPEPRALYEDYPSQVNISLNDSFYGDSYRDESTYPDNVYSDSLLLQNKFQIEGFYAHLETSPLDRFARISREEFEMRWAAMPETGCFDRQIDRIPSDEELRQHLCPKGYFWVYSEDVSDEGFVEHRAYLFAQYQGSVFLIEIAFDLAGMLVNVVFKSQEDTKTHTFISLLELQKILF